MAETYGDSDWSTSYQDGSKNAGGGLADLADGNQWAASSSGNQRNLKKFMYIGKTFENGHYIGENNGNPPNNFSDL